MNGNELIQQISKHLFWDVNVQDLDAEKHRRLKPETFRAFRKKKSLEHGRSETPC